MDIYHRELLDHYHHPRNKGSLDHPDISSDKQNPVCGDSISIQATVDTKGKWNTIVFDGKGCVISQATASMLIEHCKGEPVEQVLLLGSDFILDLIGMQLGPNRLQCALLPLQALQQGIVDYQKKQDSKHA